LRERAGNGLIQLKDEQRVSFLNSLPVIESRVRLAAD